ncbi:MAG: hypothetical protein K5739_03490 [Lachnospiraceae bacterium]|nr:hypothetical protein [Lachnospiraceae bacterium]
MSRKEWNSIQEVFAALEQESYVVLRNFEHLEEDITSADHPDIDFLCKDPGALVRILGLSRRGKVPDGIHYKMTVGGKSVHVDLRHVGDGYLDEKWEQHILQHRVMFGNLCYVPDGEDHRYSLLYHALIQKKTMAEDYRRTLSELFSEGDREHYISLLEIYMKRCGYRYSIPSYPLAVFHTQGTGPELMEQHFTRKMVRSLFAGLRS